MARGMENFHVDFELEGATATVRHQTEVEARLLNLMPAMELSMQRMEEGEQRLFQHYGGRFVRSGDLMRSLTEDATGAIREAHFEGFDFGTSIDYAVYQGVDKSPVLGFSRAEKEDIVAIIAGYVNGVGTAGGAL
jgi:hypothetical protein